MIAVVKSNDADKHVPIKEQIPSLYSEAESRSFAYLNFIMVSDPKTMMEMNDIVNKRLKSVSLSLLVRSQIPIEKTNSPKNPITIDMASWKNMINIV